MPRRVHSLLVVAILTVLCGWVNPAQAQMRAMPIGPIGSPTPVRIGPIAGPALPNNSLAPSLGSAPRLQTSDLSARPVPRIESRVPTENSAPGGSSASRPTPQAKPIAPKDDEYAPLGWSPSGPPPKKPAAGSGGGGKEPEPKSQPVLGWVKDLPGWVWFLLFLLVLAILSGLRE